MKKLILALLGGAACLFSACGHPDVYELSSPDGGSNRLQVRIARNDSGSWQYAFSAGERQLLDPAELGYVLADSTTTLDAQWQLEKVEQHRHDSVWHPVWGKRKVVEDRYNELALTFVSESRQRLEVVFRLYPDGLAFRYGWPASNAAAVGVKSERTAFRFAGDYTAWSYNGEHRNIGPEKLSDADGRRLPVMTVKADSAHYLALHEACLNEGKPLVLVSRKGDTAFHVAEAPDSLRPGFQSAWRVVFFGERPGRLVDSHLIELLNPDPDPSYDFSWVKPGMAVWDWRINGARTDDGFTYTMSYPSWIRMVDFAAEQGFRYLVLDANWYGPEFASDSDPVTGEKARDVQRLLAYAREKGVGVWLYLNDVGGRRYPIAETLAQYGQWGAAGVKYGFMKGTPEEKNQWTREITRLCAENHLLVDFHDGPVHPYGQMRTWPNAVTREFCHAQLDAHRVFVPSTFVTSVFVNMLAGPLDMNNGMFDLRQGHTTRVDESQPVPSTLVSEAARTLVVFSGATILPDIPEMYRRYPALLRFLSAQKMPWLESRTLDGEIGEYIVMMRETEDAYLVAAVTNEEARRISIPLDFLPEGRFEAEICEDGADAHYLHHRESLQSRTATLSAGEPLQVQLAPGGGCCVLIRKASSQPE